MNGRSRLNFEVGPSTGVRTVKHFVPVDIFLAAGLTDGEGKTANRILFRAKGDKTFYFMFPKGTEETMRPASPWLQEILEREMQGIEAEKAPIPEDPVTDLPSDPLGA
jgi:hypothetical protein